MLRINGLTQPLLDYLAVKPSALSRRGMSRLRALEDLCLACGEGDPGLLPGQAAMPVQDWAKRWGWARQTAASFLARLESLGFLSLRQTDSGTLVTLDCGDGLLFAAASAKAVCNPAETAKAAGDWAFARITQDDFAAFIKAKCDLLQGADARLAVGFFLCSVAFSLVAAAKKRAVPAPDFDTSSRLADLFFNDLSASPQRFAKALSWALICMAEHKTPRGLVQLRDVEPGLLAQFEAAYWRVKAKCADGGE